MLVTLYSILTTLRHFAAPTMICLFAAHAVVEQTSNMVEGRLCFIKFIVSCLMTLHTITSHNRGCLILVTE